FGAVVTSMTCKARYTRFATEVIPVDGIHHRDHSACPLNRRGFDSERVTIGADFGGMATAAVIPERRGKHPHRVHELIYRNAFQHLDILEDEVGELRVLFGTSLSGASLP